MAASQNLYPRGTVKRIVKAHSSRPMSKNADILIFLDYALFLQELMREAASEKREAGERGLTARSVRKARTKALRKFKA